MESTSPDVDAFGSIAVGSFTLEGSSAARFDDAEVAVSRAVYWQSTGT